MHQPPTRAATERRPSLTSFEGLDMSSSTTTSTRGGTGFVGLLAIVFIVLKLTGVIAWSWLWVLAPIWISALLSILIIALMILIAAAASPGRR